MVFVIMSGLWCRYDTVCETHSVDIVFAQVTGEDNHMVVEVTGMVCILQ